ncbi:MAG: dephospho-CoA kinase [Butyribacter sp.]|nr:dephospho-CoA kinase [bacterium]MDY3853375.1 dephospho-CoA kinase [Butyribacter sp.]
MYVIGLTGGVGSGKTEAAHMLAQIADAPILLADELGHLAMEPGTEGYQQIIAAFGKMVVGEDGSILRNRLAQIVFQDEQKLQQLNDIVHPVVKKYLKEYIEERKNQDGYIILESAIMFETGCDAFCDEVWYIYVPADVRKARLGESRGYSEDKSEQIIRQQLSEDEFRKRCSRTVSNAGSLEMLRKELQQTFTLVQNDKAL